VFVQVTASAGARFINPTSYILPSLRLASASCIFICSMHLIGTYQIACAQVQLDFLLISPQHALFAMLVFDICHCRAGALLDFQQRLLMRCRPAASTEAGKWIRDVPQW
jgi:hypothetical protein